MSHLLAAATRILATHCCVCGRDLADAKSVELGIGPVCRHNYFKDADIPMDADGWQRALGVVACSGLPEHIIDGVLERRPDARKATNLVVYWASAHHDDRETVLTCSNIARALGFVTLADKLEKDRAEVTLETNGTAIEVYTARNDAFNAGLYRLGAQQVRHSSGRFKCWSIPAAKKPALIVLLGVCFGGKRCFADGGIFKISPKTRADFDAIFVQAAPAPQAAPAKYTSKVSLYEKNGILYSDTPYNGDFVAAARNIRGRRYEGGSVNSYPLKSRPEVVALIQQFYGEAL